MSQQAHIIQEYAALTQAKNDKTIISQAYFGEKCEILRQYSQYSLIATSDNYQGFVKNSALSFHEYQANTRIFVAKTFIYRQDSIKSAILGALYCPAQIQVLAEHNEFYQIYYKNTIGYVFKNHCININDKIDPIIFAKSMIGVPYLWGGRTGAGFDCSGLVQNALLFAQISVPRDSKPQSEFLRQNITNPQDGDCVFWRGHVGFYYQSQLIHASGHYMQVQSEDYGLAVQRMQGAGYAIIGYGRY